jgi:hypothetical protein
MNSTTQLQRNREVAAIINLEPTRIISPNPKKVEFTTADFNSLLLEAVDSAFSMLGDPNKQALYLHLKNSFGIDRETIPQNIMGFSNMLEKVFGQSALLLESRIMAMLHKQVPHFKFSPKQEEFSFIGYLESFRRFL